MTDPQTALDRLRRANPVRHTETLDSDELGAVVTECKRRVDEARRGGGMTDETQSVPPVPVAPPPSRLRPAFVFAFAFAAVLIVVGAIALFGGAEQPAVAPKPTSTTAVSTTTPPQVVGGVASLDHFVYYSDAERTLETSVFFPAEGSGPWPVAIVYGEFELNGQGRGLARQIAERGAVVFAPTWVDEGQGMRVAAEYLTGGMWDRAACAVGYAQAHAASFGGDTTRTAVVGAAGGDHPAAWVALGLADTSACAEPISSQLTGLVAGESQWLFQEAIFDPAFAQPDAPAVDTVDRFFNPEQWRIPEELSVFLWATAWTGNSNTIDDPPAEDSWIWTRDPSGAIVEDLAAVDAFEDGLITFSDNSRLMNLRMTRAGIDVTYYESDDPGYSIDDALFDGIWALLDRE